ncbi:MAG: hypothetical protein ACKPDI_13425, partial [Actinomycetota bacterium]
RPGLVVFTDSNRDRAHHWRSSQDVHGFTESGGDDRDALRLDEGDQRLPVFGPANYSVDQTIASLEGGLRVRASAYGEPFAYRPEERAAMAVDGDPDTAWVVADRSDPVGEFIEVSNTDGVLRLLQPQDNRANRRITSVRIDHGLSIAPLTVDLDERSMTSPGQLVEVPSGTPLRITITGVGPRAGGTDTGASAVGFAELGVGAHTEVVRLPRYAEPADAPIAIVMQRLRTDPLNRWRSDPERTIERTFTLANAHEVQGSVRLRLDARASDQVINALDGTIGAVANRRLTGDPGARGVFATDDDTATAWTSPFGAAIGSTLRAAVGGERLDRLEVLQPTDDHHSTITGVRVIQGAATQEITVPPPDAAGLSVITLANPLRRGEFALEVTSIQTRTTIDRRFAEVTELPVSIVELRGDGLGRSQFALADHAPFCAADLLTLDGEPIGVSMDEGAYRMLLAGESVERPICEPGSIALTAGDHRLSTHSVAGIDVDAVVLRSADASADGAVAPTVQVQRTRLTRTATVAPCPTGCWLVLGEGYNRGWTASIDGRSLGDPAQIAGGMNGWALPASDSATVVRMEWTAQTPVTIGLLASAAAIVLCLGLALRVRRRTRPVVRLDVAVPHLDRAVLQPASLRGALASGATALVVTLLIAGPSAAAAVALPAALVVALRRPRIAAVSAALLFTALAAMAVRRQLSMRFPADAAWPSRFEHLHRPGMVVVALLVAGCVYVGRGDQAG